MSSSKIELQRSNKLIHLWQVTTVEEGQSSRAALEPKLIVTHGITSLALSLQMF
jgi:hypothetical protein